jgi:UDP-4-amino-4-deoxy-L-arabinose-oxoglutarate aminotransferase
MKIRSEFLPLSKPSIGEREINDVVSCLRSGWITTGPYCKKFEDRFCELTGAARAISLSSGTAGMHLMMLDLGITEGDEIITPSMTFSSTINMIALCGATPVFVDIDYDTMNIDATRIEEAITGRTKAIIPVHFAGAPADMDTILDIAQRHDLEIIEDAAHALGTYYKNIHAGGFGKTAIFSFHPLKNITAGEGGMITLNDEAREQHLRLLRFHGIERDAWKRYGKGGNPHYDIAEPGFKYNLTDIQAALGLAQLASLEEFNNRRRILVKLYTEGLADLPGIDLPGIPPYPHIHSWHLYIVKVLSMTRETFMRKLSDYNIGYGIHFPAGHRLKYTASRYGTPPENLRETERVADTIISLPLFPAMEDDDVLYVCDAIKEIVKND